MSFLYRFLKGKRVPSHQKCIVSLKENEPLLLNFSQFCIKNDHFVEGFMTFLNLPCSAALKKAAPIVDKLGPDFQQNQRFWRKEYYHSNNFSSLQNRWFCWKSGPSCVLWEPLFLGRLDRWKHGKLSRFKSTGGAATKHWSFVDCLMIFIEDRRKSQISKAETKRARGKEKS